MSRSLPAPARLLPALGVMGAIFLLSHQPATDLPPLFPHFDKFAHFSIYGLLAATLVSTSFTVGKAIASGLDPIILTLVRFLIAALLFVLSVSCGTPSAERGSGPARMVQT